jgi:hypothetical protein
MPEVGVPDLQGFRHQQGYGARLKGVLGQDEIERTAAAVPLEVVLDGHMILALKRHS